MKVWITKYALTTGVYEAEAEICKNISTSMICVKPTAPGAFSQHFHGEGKDWHHTQEGALKKALEMVRRKRKAMYKQQETIDLVEAKFEARLWDLQDAQKAAAKT